MAAHMRASLVAREAKSSVLDDPTISKLLIALLALISVAFIAGGVLLYLRYRKRTAAEAESLPTHHARPSSSRSSHRRLNIRPEASFVYQEKQSLMQDTDAPPLASPVPEIRITFPEEHDQAGKRQSGRVVVVHVGDKSIGFEPLHENLPSYEQNSSARFESLDLERIGGLKEKEYR